MVKIMMTSVTDSLRGIVHSLPRNSSLGWLRSPALLLPTFSPKLGIQVSGQTVQSRPVQITASTPSAKNRRFRGRGLFMSEETLAAAAPNRSILKISLGITLAMFLLIVAAVVFSDAAAEAATCTMTTTAVPTLWSNPATWGGTCPGGYPGAIAVDTAIV